jgi:hypothetical protein
VDPLLAVDVDLERGGDVEGLQSQLRIFRADPQVDPAPENCRLGSGEFGTTLGESVTNDSDLREWKDISVVCQ